MNLIFYTKTKCIGLLLLFLLGGTCSLYAQNRLITLKVNEANVDDVLSKIRTDFAYRLLFNHEETRAAGKVTLDLKNVTIETALNEIFKSNDLTFRKENEVYVIVSKKTLANGGSIQNSLNQASTTAQNAQVVRGTVTDDAGNPLPGAAVVVKGSARQHTTTNADGTFTLSNVSANATLEISFLGFETSEEAVNGRAVVNVQLRSAVSQIEELIVVGYGTTRQRNFTGSVSSIKPDAVKSPAVVTVDAMLSGKASGVSVIKADGSPGGTVRMRIRGGTSLLGTNDPLYIIDGIPTEVKNSYISSTDLTNPIEAANYGEGFNNSISGSFLRGLNNLAGLNINDIESIDILKDASATAIYGSKAANGVVVITTKRGQKDTKPILTASYSLGISNSIKKDEVLNAQQYTKAIKDAASLFLTSINANMALDPMIGIYGAAKISMAEQILNTPDYLGSANTNWLDLVLRTGYSHNADMSVSGGGGSSRYYTSLSYTNQTGTLIATDFERVSGKLNLDNDLSDWARLSTNINYGFTKNNITNGLYGQALTAPPTYAPYNEDGTYTTSATLGTDYMGYQNPLAVASAVNEGKTYMLKGTLALEMDVFKDLKFKSAASVDYNNYNQHIYAPSYVNIGGFYGQESSNGGTGSQAQSLGLNTFFENTLTYNKEFNEKHSLNVLAGTSWETQKMSYFYASGTGYPDDYYLNNLSSASLPTSVRGADPASQTSLLSFYMRANYILMDRYLFTFTGRSDASSKFGPNNRVGYFPSGAIAWRISEESFMRNIHWIDEIKLRVSAGKTGTQSIGDHMWRTLYASGSYAGSSALYPSQLGNNGIKWESTVQKDAGIDFSFFGSRLSGTLGYYDKTTDGTLLNMIAAPSSAFRTVVYNLATITNKGLELELRGDFVRTRNFTWKGSFNISGNRSKVLNIDGGPFSDPNNRRNVNLGTSIVKEGEPLGLLHGYVVKGIITTQEQLEDYRSRMTLWFLTNPELAIGDFEYELDENGRWTQDIIGHASPKFFGGYTNTFTWKNWAMSMLFTFSYGNELIYQKDVSDLSMSSFANRSVRVLDAYTPEQPSTTRPRSVWGATSLLSKASVYDASYLKLKSLYLSYTLPKKWTTRLKMDGLTLYAAASNLFTITSYPGPDPEVSDSPTSIIGGGRDASTYPTTREVTIGFRLNF